MFKTALPLHWCSLLATTGYSCSEHLQRRCSVFKELRSLCSGGFAAFARSQVLCSPAGYSCSEHHQRRCSVFLELRTLCSGGLFARSQVLCSPAATPAREHRQQRCSEFWEFLFLRWVASQRVCGLRCCALLRATPAVNTISGGAVCSGSSGLFAVVARLLGPRYCGLLRLLLQVNTISSDAVCSGSFCSALGGFEHGVSEVGKAQKVRRAWR